MAMDQEERTQQLERIAVTIGDVSFNQLLGSVREVRRDRCLRFWQESLLAKTGANVTSYAEFLSLFEGAKLKETGRAKDAVSAATSAFLMPTLTEHGFKKYGKRSFGRLMDDSVFQYVHLQLSAYGDKNFAVNYASILISCPHEGMRSTFRRLPQGKSSDGWWQAMHHERADESMLDVRERMMNVALPWFDATSTPIGLAEELVKMGHGHPSTLFELGCCYATTGNLEAAKASLREAMRIFKESYNTALHHEWMLGETTQIESLLAAIANGSHANLLSDWKEQTVTRLKLSEFCVRDRSK